MVFIEVHSPCVKFTGYSDSELVTLKKKSQCNNIIFNEVLHLFHPSLGISGIILLGQDIGILPHVHGSVDYLVMVNGN